MSRSLRVIFAGTPDFAAASLTALLDSHHQVIAVYTQPDRPAGRGRKLTPSPVKQLATQHDITVYQPLSLKEADAQQALAALDADVMVVVAYGLILPRTILETPRLGCINVHASLLPRWRGAAPLQRAIEAGDDESGVTLMQMDEGLDTGDMLRVARTPITDTTTGGELHDSLAALGGKALLHTLDDMAQGNAVATPQPEQGVTYAAKLTKAEAELDFYQDAAQLAARIRAFNPWPVAWCVLGDDRLRLLMAHVGHLDEGESPSAPGTLLAHHESFLRIACGASGDQVLCVSQAQLPGGKVMPVYDLLLARAERLAPGIRLGKSEASQ
ncbi:methionyl-tRNA formyltransferase [Halomonas halocynthiae]|uniref:methionyl-tRNA formyltransferase n=1 Tax=Halomonas halocynthiae TaxID=176290 RepID=UPI0004811D89|nr:methionyl-tRNA formyltransferase [Halomonas halocynthiae]